MPICTICAPGSPSFNNARTGFPLVSPASTSRKSRCASSVNSPAREISPHIPCSPGLVMALSPPNSTTACDSEHADRTAAASWLNASRGIISATGTSPRSAASMRLRSLLNSRSKVLIRCRIDRIVAGARSARPGVIEPACIGAPSTASLQTGSAACAPASHALARGQFGSSGIGRFLLGFFPHLALAVDYRTAFHRCLHHVHSKPVRNLAIVGYVQDNQVCLFARLERSDAVSPAHGVSPVDGRCRNRFGGRHPHLGARQRKDHRHTASRTGAWIEVRRQRHRRSFLDEQPRRRVEL